MSVLYDLRLLIEAKIKAEGLDAAQIRGQVGLKSGRILSLISPNTPDDPAALAKMRQAARDILHMSV